MQSRILVVEDEVHLAQGLQFNLEAEGHAVVVTGDGEDALVRLLTSQETYDAIVLDVMLPGKDGFAVAHELRQQQNFTPILMLTARSRPEDVLKGFEAGADDYLAKPFNLAILLARIDGLLRRHRWMQQPAGQVTEGTGMLLPARGEPDPAPRRDKNSSSGNQPLSNPEITDTPTFHFSGKVVDFQHLRLEAGGKIFQLTIMEADFLQYLIRHANRPVSRKAILSDVWDLHEDTDTRAIDNFIVRLRRYIEDEPATPRHLITVRGLGYQFNPEPK